MNVLVTGASGGLGSHLIEAFAKRGHRVAGLTRSLTAVSHLESTNADFVLGDVNAESSLIGDAFRRDCIVHTVARVGGGARWRDHFDTDQTGTANVLTAAHRAGCPRFIHISSIAALDLPKDGGAVVETTPLRSHAEKMNRYARSKLEVEKLVREYERKGRIAVTVLRPSVFLGRYDRHTTPSIIRFLRSPLAGLIGEGDNLIPCVDLHELAYLVVRAAESDRAVGRTYNVSGRQSVPLADLLAIHATEIGRRPHRRYSERTARTLAALLESGTRLLNRKNPPLIDRFMVDVATLNCTVDCSRAEEDLNWSGRGDLRHAIRQSIAWQEETSR
jgi:nucleoside-diphosphate-sugar epimerase